MSIGATLKQAREAAGLTLLAVSEQTRMRQTMIAAIEKDDFTLCGGSVYARGHIRSIARVVGIDSVPLITEFDGLYGDPTVDDLIESTPIVLAKERRNPWQPAMIAAGLALFAIAGVAIAQSDSDQPIAQQTATSTPTPSETNVPDATESDAVANAGDGVTFTADASAAESWLSVRTADGTQLFQGILRKGESRTFSDDTNLRVVLGNAGGVEITVNGKSLGLAGAAGAVVRFDLVPGDPGIG